MMQRIPRRYFLAGATPALAALRPSTLEAYRQYIGKVEARVEQQNQSREAFLWSATVKGGTAQAIAGQTLTQKLGTPAFDGGLVQHWIGAAFFPKATMTRVLEVDQDYERYKEMYAPDIVASKLLGRSGNRFDIYYRLRKKKVVTAVMDTRHQVEFRPLGAGRQTITSRSTEVREVEDFGEATERVLPVGEGQGFLYAMNSYWRMQESDGGVHVECEAITLARTLPFGLRTVIGPLIESFAVESLKSTLDAKRRAVQARG